LNCKEDYDKLQEIANNHKTLRQMLGHGILDVEKRYPRQTLCDNLRWFTPEILDSINRIVVEEGHRVLDIAEGEKLHARCNSFVVEPLGGKRHIKITERRTRIDWAVFIKEMLDTRYPEAEKVVLVMDNLNTHSTSSLYEAFPPQEARRLTERLEIHYTPKHGSWLNIAEIELSVLKSQCLDRRIPEIELMGKEVSLWTSDRNNRQANVNWQFTTNDARIKLYRLYPKL
jgi:hypothetical protein